MFIGDLHAIVQRLSELVAILDPDAVPPCEASDLWKEFDRAERFAASAKTLLARRVEDANTWKRAGYRSAAEHQAALSGSSVTAAKSALETSRRVNKLPKTAAAMRNGELSAAKAEAIADAAAVAPGAEAALLDGSEKARWVTCASAA